MSMMINPGSRFDQSLPNTYVQAEDYAVAFHAGLAEIGIPDVELVLPGVSTDGEAGGIMDGRWRFVFRHRVTGVEVDYETHGVPREIEGAEPFGIRWYWDGSSYNEPNIDHFLTDDWVAVQTTEIRRATATSAGD